MLTVPYFSQQAKCAHVLLYNASHVSTKEPYYSHRNALKSNTLAVAIATKMQMWVIKISERFLKMLKIFTETIF